MLCARQTNAHGLKTRATMQHRFAIILPAAGRSVRFGTDKLRATLAGRSVLNRSIAAFAERLGRDVAQIIVAGDSDGLPMDVPITRVAGGASRAHTVRNALDAVDPSIAFVAIHDAARPLVSQTLVDRVFTAAVEHGAAAPAMPVQLTIKQTAGTSLPATIERTIPRASLWAMQTPQVMRRTDLLDAYARCPLPLDQITDDVQLLELIGRPVMLVPGDERNLKLTTPLDLKLAELLLTTDH